MLHCHSLNSVHWFILRKAYVEFYFLKRCVVYLLQSFIICTCNFSFEQVCIVSLISVLRCVVSMTVNASVLAGDITDKVSDAVS